MVAWIRIPFELTRNSVAVFNRVNAFRLAAALAFCVALSLAPILVIVVGLAGTILGGDAARGGIESQIRDLIGPDGAQVVQTLLANDREKHAGPLATVFGFVALFVGATGVFVQMQDALNAVWETPPRKSSGWGIKNLIRDRILSFSVVAGIAFLLLVSLMTTAFLSTFQAPLKSYLGDGTLALQVIEAILSFALSTVLFALVFKILPDRRVRWKNVAIGALVTGVLFNAGKYLIGLYLGTAVVGSPYGAAGSLVVLLVWVYYSALILLFGAGFTRVYSEWNTPTEATTPPWDSLALPMGIPR